MPNYSNVLIDSIEREQKGLDYICPKADRELLHKLLDEITQVQIITISRNWMHLIFLAREAL